MEHTQRWRCRAAPGCHRCRRATDDDWIADFDCMYTDDLHKEFDAPPGSGKLQLHKGFWSAFKVVDSQLLLEVNKAVLKIKV